MLKNYKPTQLEKEIQRLYNYNNITHPNDLDIEIISERLNINIVYTDKGPSRAIYDEEDAMIFLNKNNPKERLRDIFFHELCHPLRHYGDQQNMAKEFRELQEAQANHFQLYAAIPYYMLRNLDLSPFENILIGQLRSIFNVTEKLVRNRIEQIKRRNMQTELDQQFVVETKKVYNIYHNEPDRQMWKDNANAIAQLAIQRKRAKELIKL